MRGKNKNILYQKTRRKGKTLFKKVDLKAAEKEKEELFIKKHAVLELMQIYPAPLKGSKAKRSEVSVAHTELELNLYNALLRANAFYDEMMPVFTEKLKAAGSEGLSHPRYIIEDVLLEWKQEIAIKHNEQINLCNSLQEIVK